ncbi:mucin-5AC-like [Gadus macrocephalus]|uniref:mucin-5AC-like n=1 Tax=Gadus macrocephalus TaxID=80720 RepID=UPI0028CB20DF|nr:mucin-5AC-like [Gadus macrocephalus]
MTTTAAPTSAAPTTITAASTTTTAAPTRTTAAPTTTTAVPTTTIASPTTTTPAVPTTTAAPAGPQEPPTVNEGSRDVSFSLQRPFESALSDSDSPEFQSLADEVTREVNNGYKLRFPGTFSRSLVRSFTNGSVIVDLTVVFTNLTVVPNGTVAVETLIQALATGTTNLAVIVSTITLSQTASTAAPTTTTAAPTTTTAAPTTTTAAPTTTTAAPTTTTAAPDSTESPAADEGTLDLSFSLTRTFQSSLSDPTSPAYRVLTNEVTREVNKGYRFFFPRTYSRSVVRSFRNGSILVEMILVFQNQTVVPTGVLAEQALQALISSGITNLTGLDLSTITARQTASTAAPTTTTAAPTTTTAAPTTTTAAPTTTTAAPTTTTAAPDSTESPAADEGTLDLSFSLTRTFQSSLSDPTSPAYRVLTNEVTREVNKGYRFFFPRTYSRSVVRSFRNGSILVEMILVFQNQTVVPTGVLAEQALQALISSGITNLTGLDLSTITATTTTSGGPTLKMTTTTAFCLPIFLTVIKGLLFST